MQTVYIFEKKWSYIKYFKYVVLRSYQISLKNVYFNFIIDYLEDVYANLAMANYPYKNDFIAPLPAYPVRQFCYYLRDFYKQDIDLLNVSIDNLFC